MTEVAALGLRVDSSGIEKGIKDLKDLTKAGESAEKAANRLSKSEDGVSAAASKMGGSVAKASTITRTLGSEASTTSGSLDRLARGAGGSGATGSLHSMADAMGTVTGRLIAMAGAAIAFGNVVSTLSGFEEQMAAVAAVSGATGRELEALRDTAKELGASTEFSASQAASGLKILTQAGYTARDAIATLPTVLDLATTEGMELGAATEYVNSIMAGFGLGVKDAARVADVLVYASNAASTGVAELGEGMKYVAPIAASLGISIEETAAAMGVLSDAGLKGTIAGTALRGIMATLAAPTKNARAAMASLGVSVKDLDPQLNSISDIVDTLTKANIKAADAFAIFGTEAAPAIMALVANNDKLKDFVGNMDDVEGTTKRVADIMRDQLGGDLKGLMSAIEGVIISLGEAGLTAALSFGVQMLTDFARAVSAGIDSLQGFAGYIIAAGAAFTAYLIPSMLAAVPVLWANVAAAGAAVAAFVTLRGAMIATGIGAFVVVAGYLVNKFIQLVEKTGSFSNAIAALGTVWTATQNWLSAGADALGDVFLAITNRIGAYFTSLWARVQSGFATMMQAIQGGINKMISGLNAISVDMPEWMGGGTVGFSIEAANFADGFTQAAEESAKAAKSLHDAADSAIAMSKTRFDNIEGPATALARIMRGDGEAFGPEWPGAGTGAVDLGGGGGGGGGVSSAGGGKGKGGGGGKGKNDQFASNLQNLIESLRTEQETVTAWYESSQKILADRRAQEILGKEGHNAAMIALEQEYQSKLGEIKQAEIDRQIGGYSSMFGALAGIAQAGGARLVKIAATFGAIQGTIDAYGAYLKALNSPVPMTPWGRAAAALNVLGAGLKGVAAIKSAGGGGGGGGGGGSVSGGTQAQAQPTQGPQDVRIDLRGADAAQQLLAQSILGPLIEGLQKQSKHGVNITGIRTV